MLPLVEVTRYVTPLREGGSLPGLVEAEDLGTYVCKFAGAGQGRRVLVAEVIAGELARRLGFATPRLVRLDLPADLARYEADEEVQDLLRASVGHNLGVDFLPGSFGFDAGCEPDPSLAARVLWLDAYLANVDRSWRNPNLLLWHGEVWLIDHGASLYFHHAWSGGLTDPARFARQPWNVDDHVLAAWTDGVAEADAELAPQITEDLLTEIVALVPEEWMDPVPGPDGPLGPADVRAAYVAFLLARAAGVDGVRPWLPTGSAS